MKKILFSNALSNISKNLYSQNPELLYSNSYILKTTGPFTYQKYINKCNSNKIYIQISTIK